uniref:Peroxisome membrane anchor protein Pex14p N-terminal domain-containing protein n=1 Tax=Globisporangium ultimum (strain ATCC 200006 / CBS 805.95 / DAOM BR144) TaxID=431595 RepID=K3WWD5_GLOUD
MAHDRAFLERCEAFLLHPTVRTLSLAQRVDFLEKKGLSPEEITACLKNIQQQNGLSKVLASAATSAADQLARTGDGALMPRAPPSWRTAVLTMIKRYGVISFLTLLLGYGYIRFRQRVEEQMVIKRRLQQVQSRARRSTKIQGMLSLISDQQAQYQQAVLLLQKRVTKFQEAQKKAASESSTALVTKG